MFRAPRLRSKIMANIIVGFSAAFFVYSSKPVPTMIIDICPSGCREMCNDSNGGALFQKSSGTKFGMTRSDCHLRFGRKFEVPILLVDLYLENTHCSSIIDVILFVQRKRRSYHRPALSGKDCG